MQDAFVFTTDLSSEAEITAHLWLCDDAFDPTLSSRAEIGDYACKIVGKAVRFEAWRGDKLVGMVAAYCNQADKGCAFITSVSVLSECQGLGIASQLILNCLCHIRKEGFQRIELEVYSLNHNAVNLYKKYGFSSVRINGAVVLMSLEISQETEMSVQRDFNLEIKDTADHQYAYSFDFDVMHPYMIRSFRPFFRPGSLLELGSFKGDFTRRFLEYFDDVTCVEASDEALSVAKAEFGDRIHCVNSMFETAILPRRYDNIVMTHVLENLSDPVVVLKRIREEWLAVGGRFFLVCPNANAPSRQIAVKMGLISHSAAVTPAEAAHGHRCTYSLDTLERDAVAAGFNVMNRSGIFFKAFANFQWDRLLNTDIVSKEYLEGCYKLGQQYPDLCASIFLLCESLQAQSESDSA